MFNYIPIFASNSLLMSKLPRPICYAMIVIGFLLAFYGQGNSDSSQYIMIFGLVILMAGIYGISSKLSSRNNDSEP